jgi:hypothetical protein
VAARVLACGPEVHVARDGAGCWPDSDSSPSLAQGRRRPRQVGPVCQRAKGEGERKQAARADWPGGRKLGRAEEERKEELGCWTGPRGGEKKTSWARPCERKEEKRKARLGRAAMSKKRGKRKTGSGPGPIRKRGRKRIAFKCI